MPNRPFLALPMYGPVYPRFYQHWLGVQAAFARAARLAIGPEAVLPILTVNMAYIDHADTQIVNEALTNKDWDYLVLIEHDNIVPKEWAEVVVNELDPEVHKIVGRWYFGKAQEDQRSICGYIRPSGDFDRLSFDEVQFFRQHPGLYRIGAGQDGVDESSTTFSVGMGCTAIHRSVFENWDGPMPWFQSISSWNEDKHQIGYLGHDVNFCMNAAKQGYHVWVDTRKACGHIGEFVSDDETYTATAQFMASQGRASKELLAGKPDPAQLPPGIPTAMKDTELKAVGRLSIGKTVLEIGSRYGASTLSMAGSGATIVYALDWHRGDQWHGEPGGIGNTLEVFWRYCQKYKLQDKIVPLVGKSDQVLPRLTDASFDLILIDGDHSYAGAKYDMEQALRLLAPGGSVAVHDFNREEMFPYPQGSDLEIGVTRACKEILGEPDELVETIAIYHDPARLQGLHVLTAS